MRKLFIILLAGLIFPAITLAASVFTFRLSEIKTPINTNEFYLDFVAVDLSGQPVTVRCYKKSPSDSGYTQFGGEVNLGSGGGSGRCKVDSAILNSRGIYEFRVDANNAIETKSLQQSVNYETESPGDLRDWSKTRADCVFKIKVKTAQDNGKTTKVEFYRSTEKSFDTNDGTRVGSYTAGSDQEVTYESTVPECTREYYFAARAFNSSGNGSGVIGDSYTITKNVEIIPTSQPQTGAIPLSQGQGSVLGSQESTSGKASQTGQVEGEATGSGEASEKPSDETSEAQNASKKGFNGPLIGGIVAIALVLFYAITRKKPQEE